MVPAGGQTTARPGLFAVYKRQQSITSRYADGPLEAPGFFRLQQPARGIFPPCLPDVYRRASTMPAVSPIPWRRPASCDPLGLDCPGKQCGGSRMVLGHRTGGRLGRRCADRGSARRFRRRWRGTTGPTRSCGFTATVGSRAQLLDPGDWPMWRARGKRRGDASSTRTPG